MQKHNDPAYCKQVCAGMMPPRPLPKNRPRRVSCPSGFDDLMRQAMKEVCYKICCTDCLDAAGADVDVQSCLRNYCNDCEGYDTGSISDAFFTVPEYECWENCPDAKQGFTFSPWQLGGHRGIIRICLSNQEEGQTQYVFATNLASTLLHEMAHTCDRLFRPGSWWPGGREGDFAEKIEDSCFGGGNT